MEFVKILCCGKEEGDLMLTSQLIDNMTNALNITLKNRTEKCLADYLQEEIDDNDINYYEYTDPFELSADFIYQIKECKVQIKRITKNCKRFFELKISYKAVDDITLLNNSIWFDFKESLIEMLYKSMGQLFWLTDSQNTKIATNLYYRLHGLENYLRDIINTYMSLKHGGDWFEKYSYEDHINKYLCFSDWFRKSRYDLFKKIDNHLANLEIDDLFVALKAAKKKQLTSVLRKALEDIKKNMKDNIEDIAGVELLDTPSLWDEERFDDIFSREVVGRWKNDLSKRRNMIAHNKMICRKMYFETLSQFDFFQNSFKYAEKLLNAKCWPDEELEVSRLFRDSEITLNLESCNIDPNLLDVQDIIYKLNESDDFINLSSIVNDKLACLDERANELLSIVEDIKSVLNEDSFFENDQFIGKELLQQYIAFAHKHYLYTTWKTLLDREISKEIYALIEPGLFEYFANIEEKLTFIKHSAFYVDLSRVFEGELVRVKDFEGNVFTIEISGCFSPERGNVDELFINWTRNGEILDHGGVFVSYGDYEMTEDDTPLPFVADEFTVRFNNINSKLEAVIDGIFEVMSKIEDQLIKIGI